MDNTDKLGLLLFFLDQEKDDEKELIDENKNELLNDLNISDFFDDIDDDLNFY